MGIEIGHNLKSARNAAGLTQEELAQQCGVATITIRQYESGKREPKYDTLERLADALGVPLEVLLGIGDSVKIDFTPEEKQAQQVVNRIREGLKKAGPLRQMSDAEAHRMGFLQFNSDEDRIAFFYSRLNTDGKLAASKCFYQHLDKDHIGEVADYVEKLSEIPQYQRPAAPQSPPAPQGGKDTTPAPDAPETPPEGE